jgi:membrane dipeptidase
VPVICSHTNIRALNENPRCISDRLIEAIAATGGVVGITAMNDFHARNPSNAGEDTTPQVGLDRHLDQYDHIRKLVGADHVALGPDFVEGTTVPTDEQSNTVIWPWYWNSKKWIYIKGFENIAELPNVVGGLLDRGWSSAEIRKVLGENWLRVYERVWGA